LKIAAKILKYFGLFVALAVVGGYLFVMRPAFLEPIVISAFEKQTHGKLEIKIVQASLFRGFKFANVVVHPGAGYKKTPIFKAREVNLLYNVFGFFRGKFGVHEIALRDADIFIEQKKNITNAEALPKPSEAKKPEPEEPPKKSDANSTVISWFFDIQIFAKIAIENFHFVFDSTDASNKDRRFAEIKDFSFGFSLLTKNFSSVDTANTASLVGLLNALVIELNPQRTIGLTHRGLPVTIDTKLALFWRLFYDGMSARPEFISRMQIGQDKLLATLAGGRTQDLAFLLGHKIDYNAKDDNLKIVNFDVKFLGDTLLALTGEGQRVVSDGRSIAIQTGASRVNLGKLYEIASAFGSRDPVFSGFFSIKPTKVKISGARIEDEGGLKLEGVFVRSGKFAFSIPTFELDHAANIDQNKKPLPVEKASVKLRSVINGAPLGLDLSLAGDQKTQVDFYLRGFDITPFADRQAVGQISTTFSAKGPSPQDLNIDLRVFSPQLIYYLDRAKSGINRIDFNVKGSVKSSEDFSTNNINLPVIYFSDKNKEYNNAIELKSHVTVAKARDMRVVYTLDALTITIFELLNTLPASLQEDLAVQLKAFNLGKTLRADGQTQVDISGNTLALTHATHLALPDIGIDDIAINAKMRQRPGLMNLDLFSITGLKGALKVNADGTVKDAVEIEEDAVTHKKKRVAVSVPDLKYRVELSKKEETEILTDMFLVGTLAIPGSVKGNIISGVIDIDNLSFKNAGTRVNQINMDFPFKHDIKLKKSLNLRAGNKERIIKNYHFNRAYNFTIQSIEIPNPNIKGEWMQIIYPRANYPAIGGSMEYKDNVFVMPVMQMYMLNGVVTISDTLINLGRFVGTEMEYSAAIQVKDIDLKPMMTKEKADSITDGRLRIDMLFTGIHFDKLMSGIRFEKFLENLSGYLSVFYIGPEFAQMVMRASNPKQSNIISTLASSAATPKRIDVDLREGFVYTNIPMSAGVVGNMLFSPDEINNRRINIPEFFQRIATEANKIGG